MAVPVTDSQQNYLGEGRNCVRSSSGIPYVVLVSIDMAGYPIRVFKGNSTTPASFQQMDTQYSPPTSSSSNTAKPSCAIDSTDVIHIVYAYNVGATPMIKYITFNTNTDTFSAEENITGDTGNTLINSRSGCDISIDSNDIPHVVYIGIVSNMGTYYNTLYYTNKVGGSWKTGVEVYGETAKKNVWCPTIAIGKANMPLIGFSIYNSSTNKTWSFAAGNTNNSTSFEIIHFTNSYSVENNEYQSTIVNSADGSVYFGYFASTFYIHRHVHGYDWQTWVQISVNGGFGTLATDGSDLYYFFEDSNSDIAYNKYSGTWGSGSWSGPTVVETGTFRKVMTKHAYWVDNGSNGPLVTSKVPYIRLPLTEIDYVFSDETLTPDIHFNTLILVAPVAFIPRIILI